VILKKLSIHPVSTIDEVLELALTEMPEPLPAPLESENLQQKKGENAVVTH